MFSVYRLCHGKQKGATNEWLTEGVYVLCCLLKRTVLGFATASKKVQQMNG